MRIGGYGKGERFPIEVSRRLLTAIQSGHLDNVETVKHPVFGFAVPTSCPGVESRWLQIPGGEQVTALAKKFHDNFKQFLPAVSEDVADLGGPRLPELNH